MTNLQAAFTTVITHPFDQELAQLGISLTTKCYQRQHQ